MTNISKMTEIASKTLGDSTSYAVYTYEYDPSLLNPMPRNLARDENNISGSEFDGFDVWHCYEATFLTDQGHPVSGILKIVYPADTENMVESKSMKLFLNSFDMCKMGSHVQNAIPNYISAVRDSIAKCLGDERVDVNFFRHVDILRKNVTVFENKLVSNADYYDICERDELEDINEIYKQDKKSYITLSSKKQDIHLMFESLRSRCRHTKQKDTGTAIVRLVNSKIDIDSIYNQINSMRETNEFHEFCAERLFVELALKSDDLVIVALLYTRRGSLDINPIRYSKNIFSTAYRDYIYNFANVNVLTLPTIIQ